MEHPGFGLLDALWEEIKPFLPEEPPKPKGGRPRMDDRQAMAAILYVLRTGIQWKPLSRSFGAASTVHDRFQYWAQKGVFRKMWAAGLRRCDEARDIDWEWQVVDGAITKAPLGGKGTDPNPTDRGKSGTKRAFGLTGGASPWVWRWTAPTATT